MARGLTGIVAAAALLLPATAAQAATFNVTTTTDSSVGDGNCIVGSCTLRQAITAANAAAGQDTVTVPAGTYHLANGELASTDDLVLQGSATIDADGASRVLLLSAPTAISGLTITDGVATDSPGDPTTARGGGIYAGDALTLRDVVVSDNQASGTGDSEGGGVYVDAAGEPRFDDVTLSGNVATATGTAHASGGGAYLPHSGPFGLSRMTVRNNVVEGDDGNAGGGGLASLSSAMTVQDSTFAANIARTTGNGGATGGGILMSAGRILRSRISGGTSLSEGATAFGGGVEAFGGLELVDSTVDDNLVLSNGPSGEEASGGGVFGLAAALTITNSTITGNQAQALDGASAMGGGVMFSDDTVITATTITANNAFGTDVAGSGGGIAQTLPGSGLTLRGTIVSGNVQDTGGDCGAGTVHSDGGNVVDLGVGCTVLAAATDVVTADPGLNALADNGGPTPTMYPQPTSLALGRYAPVDNACFGERADQRGLLRPQGGSCDAGAVEFFVPTPPSPTPAPTPVAPVAPVPPAITPTPSATPSPTCPDRRVTVRLNPRGVHFVRARVSVDGTAVEPDRDGTKWTASFDLRGRPGQEVEVVIRGRRANGRLLTRTRTLTVC